MLKLKAPIQLQCTAAICTCGLDLSQKLLSNYRLLPVPVEPEDLLFLLVSQEQPEELWDNPIAQAFSNSQVNNTALQIEIVNNLVNRIINTESKNFTYSDVIYISTALQKFGINNTTQFIEQVRQIKNQGLIIENLQQQSSDFHWHLGDRMGQAAANPRQPLGGSLPSEQANPQQGRNLYLQEVIFQRLQTRSLYQTVQNFSRGWQLDQRWINKQELLTARQLFQVKQSNSQFCQQVVDQSHPLFLEPHYVTPGIHPEEVTEATPAYEPIVQIAYQALLNTISSVIYSRLSHLSRQESHFFNLQESLQSSATSVLQAYKTWINERSQSEQRSALTLNSRYYQSLWQNLEKNQSQVTMEQVLEWRQEQAQLEVERLQQAQAQALQTEKQPVAAWHLNQQWQQENLILNQEISGVQQENSTELVLDQRRQNQNQTELILQQKNIQEETSWLTEDQVNSQENLNYEIKEQLTQVNQLLQHNQSNLLSQAPGSKTQSSSTLVFNQLEQISQTLNQTQLQQQQQNSSQLVFKQIEQLSQETQQQILEQVANWQQLNESQQQQLIWQLQQLQQTAHNQSKDLYETQVQHQSSSQVIMSQTPAPDPQEALEQINQIINWRQLSGQQRQQLIQGLELVQHNQNNTLNQAQSQETQNKTELTMDQSQQIDQVKQQLRQQTLNWQQLTEQQQQEILQMAQLVQYSQTKNNYQSLGQQQNMTELVFNQGFQLNQVAQQQISHQVENRQQLTQQQQQQLIQWLHQQQRYSQSSSLLQQNQLNESQGDLLEQGRQALVNLPATLGGSLVNQQTLNQSQLQYLEQLLQQQQQHSQNQTTQWQQNSSHQSLAYRQEISSQISVTEGAPASASPPSVAPASALDQSSHQTKVFTQANRYKWSPSWVFTQENEESFQPQQIDNHSNLRLTYENVEITQQAQTMRYEPGLPGGQHHQPQNLQQNIYSQVVDQKNSQQIQQSDTELAFHNQYAQQSTQLLNQAQQQIYRQNQEIRQRNTEIQKKLLERDIRETREVPGKPNKNKTIDRSLEALADQRQFIQQLQEESSGEPRRALLELPNQELMDEETRRIMELTMLYERDPTAALRTGMVRQGSPEGLQRELAQQQAENLAVAEQVFYQPKQPPEEPGLVATAAQQTEKLLRRQSAGLLASQRIEERREAPAALVHRVVHEAQPSIEEAVKRQQQVQKNILEEEKVVNQQVHSQTTINHVSTETLNQKTENVTELVDRVVNSQLSSLADKVYSNIEKRLKTERARRGV